VLATLCSELIWASPVERREALAAEALKIAEASGDEATIVRVLNTVSFPLLVPSLLEQSLARTAEALARAERLGDPLLLFWATWWRGQAVQLAGDIDELDRCLAIAGRLAEQVDQPMLSWTHTLYLGIRALISGDTDRAEQLAEEAHQLGTESGQADATLYFGMQLTSISIQRGTMGDLVPFIEQMIAEAPYLAGAATAVLAFAHVEGDRLDDAARLLEEFASTGFDLPLNSSWLTAMVCYAEAAIAVRVPEHAAAIFDRLAPWADQWCSVGASAEGPVSRSLGGLAHVLGRYDQADSYFLQSAAMSQRMGSKFFAAWTDLMWGNLLAERRGRSDLERARGLLTKAHSAAAAHGYGNVERRAAKTLQLLDT